MKLTEDELSFSELLQKTITELQMLKILDSVQSRLTC